MPTPLNFDPGTWNSSTVAPYTLGALYETGGKVYQYVQLTDAVAGTNGAVVEPTATANTVTLDRAGGSSVCNGLAAASRQAIGVLVGTVTAGNYCFMQIGGYHPAVQDSINSLTISQRATAAAGVDGDAIVAGNVQNTCIGITLAAASGGSVPMWLMRGA